MTLEEFFKEYHKAAIGFSGGVDSSYLLYAASRCHADVTAYYVKTPFQPAFELEDARRIAAETGARLKILEYDILQDAQVTANPPNRCYYCKTKIFSAICRAARADGYELVLDGTNASDDPGDRPGNRALHELGVLSPLAMCGLTKTEVRRRSKEAGLFTWDKPSYACLATRIPADVPIRQEMLTRIEKGEDLLRQEGFTDCRLRWRDGAALIQVPEEQIKQVVQKRKTLLQQLQEWFPQVSLDLQGRIAFDEKPNKKPEEEESQ